MHRSESESEKTFLRQLSKFLTPPDDLLHWKDMPQHLQFNPYVLTGYRPLQTVKGCLTSLFYLHNETINILTHGEYLFWSIGEKENKQKTLRLTMYL
jgi:hypothetical protein